MRIPKLEPIDAAYYLRVITSSTEYYELDELEVKLICSAIEEAEAFCAAQTGLKTERELGSDGENNADLLYAVKIKTATIYDNRQNEAQYSTENPTVSKILAQHSRNLLPGGVD